MHSYFYARMGAIHLKPILHKVFEEPIVEAPTVEDPVTGENIGNKLSANERYYVSKVSGDIVELQGIKTRNVTNAKFVGENLVTTDGMVINRADLRFLTYGVEKTFNELYNKNFLLVINEVKPKAYHITDMTYLGDEGTIYFTDEGMEKQATFNKFGLIFDRNGNRIDPSLFKTYDPTLYTIFQII